MADQEITVRHAQAVLKHAFEQLEAGNTQEALLLLQAAQYLLEVAVM